MNILQVQDDLKNFSQQQLIQEMKQPKGVAPQFLVLGEITRRKRMSDDMKTRGAADQKTVAQEVVSAAGVPQGGLAQMSQAMAPKSSIEPNMQPPSQVQPQAPMTMASGGILSLAVGGKPKKGETFFLEFPNNSPILAGERREVTANTLEKLKSEMPVFFKRMLKRGEVLSSEDASEAYKKTATKLVPLQLNFAVRKAKESIAQAEEAARIAELQAETGATDDQAVTSAGRPTESQVIDEVQSLDAPVAEPSEYDIQQDSDIEGDLLMADDYEKAVSDRLAQDNIRRRQEAEIARKQSSIDAQTVPDAVIPTGTSGPPSSGFASPLQQAQNEKAFQEKIAFDARSDEAAAISAELREKQEAAVRKARENARAYAEGRTPKQEEQREFDRQNARDSAITALGQIDRSNEPVGFRQIMENKALQQAAIAQANPNMFGDLGAPNTMQEELARKAAEDEAAKEAQAEAQLQSYLRNMEAPTDMIGGIRESDLVREMRTSNEMANQAKIDEILSGGRQGMAFNANLASPELDRNVARAMRLKAKEDEMNSLRLQAATNQSIEGAAPVGNYSQIVDDLGADRQKREAAERIALKDATEMSIDSAAPIGNYGQLAADALRADVDVRDAELGGAFAKGDDGTEQGFFFDDPSTSEIIQRQLDLNKAADERQKRNDDLMITGESSGYGDEDQRLANEQAKFSIVDPYAADRAAIASSDTILNDDVQNDIAYLDNRIEGAKAVLAGGGNIYTPGRNPPFQSYNLQTYEESPSVTMPYYEKPMLDETKTLTEQMDLNDQGEAERIAVEGRSPNMFGYGGVDADPLMFGSETPNIYPEGTRFFDPRFVEKEREDLISKGVSEVRAEDARSGLMTPNEILGMDSAGMSFVGAPDTTPNDPKSLDMSRLITREDGTNVVADFGQNRQGEANNTEMDNYAFYDGPETGADAEEEFGKDNPFAPVPFKKAKTAADTKNETDAATDTALGGSGSKSTKSGTGGSASSQILDLLKSQEANADSDKWLALANAGMALMSSKQPTLGGALGEAGQVGIAGLMKSRQAADAAKLKTLKFQAGLEAAAAKAGLPKDRYKSDVSLYNNTTDNIRGLLTQKGASSSTDFLNAVEGTGPDEISKEDKAQLVYLIRMQREAARRLGYDNPPPVKKIS